MKRVLFCLSDFKQGGIPRCLQSLLEQLDTSFVKADVLCLYQDGPYKGALKNCRVLPEDYVVSRLMVHTKKIGWRNIWKHLPALALKCWRTLILKLTRRDILTERLHQLASKCSGYDAVIAYAEGMPAQLVEQITCSRKFVWIHNDYSWECARSGASQTNFPVFEKVVCVSEAARQAWIACYPHLEAKTETLYNIINEEHIRARAEDPLDDPDFCTAQFTLVSIGRVCAQKQFEVIPSIAAELKKAGGSFHWYIIGGGPKNEEELVRSAIRKQDVQACVTLLGEKVNPYPYLKQADAFVLTSRYESYPTVINEAAILQVPIVANDIPCVREMLHEYDGIVVDIKHMAQSLTTLLNHNSLRGGGIHQQQILDAHSHNASVMKGFYSLLE